MVLKISAVFLRSQRVRNNLLFVAGQTAPCLPKMLTSRKKLSFNISTKSEIFSNSIFTLLASSFFCLAHLAILVCSVVGKWEDRSEGRTECNRSDKIF